jgi:hypothetical protein
MSIFTKDFTIAALERAFKTMAQAAVLAIIGTGAMSSVGESVNVFEVNWLAVLGFAAGGFVLSYLTSIVSNPFGSYAGPSLADEAVMYTEIVAEVDFDEDYDE